MSNIWIVALFFVIFSIIENLLIFKFILRFNRKFHDYEIASAYDKQLNMNMKYYEAFENYDKKLREISHDLKNQMQVIDGLVKMGEYNDALYLISIGNTRIDNLKTVYYCDNKIINSLLYFKYKEMEKRQIEFIRSSFRLKEDEGVDNLDLCKIISNFLDNAIEEYDRNFDVDAENSLLYGKKYFIKLQIKFANSYLIIKVENPLLHQIKISDEAIQTSKEDTKNHGLGLKIVKDITEKYQGKIKIKLKDSENESEPIFLVMAILKCN